MTNEELAIKIQSGEKDLLCTLWLQVEKYIHSIAVKYTYMLIRNCVYGITIDDLYQSGYFALEQAAMTFNPDKNMSFIGWLTFSLRSEFRKAAGISTTKRDPLLLCVSLDSPVLDEGSSATIGDLREDPAAALAMMQADDRIFFSGIHDILNATIQAMPEAQKQVLFFRYGCDLSISIAAKRAGLTLSEARKAEAKALRAFRHPDVSNRLRSYCRLDC